MTVVKTTRLTINEVLNHHCVLVLDHGNTFFSQGLWWCTIKQSFSCKQISSFENVIVWLYEPSYIFENSKTIFLPVPCAMSIFHMTIRLTMMHHHTKFGYKRSSNLEDIIQTNIIWIFEPLGWPWLQQSTLFTGLMLGLWWSTIMQSVVSKDSLVQKM